MARKIYFSSGIYLVSAPSECDHSSEARGHQESGSAAPAPTGGHCWVLGQDVQFVTAPSITQHSRHGASSVLSPHLRSLPLSSHSWIPGTLRPTQPNLSTSLGGPIWPDPASLPKGASKTRDPRSEPKLRHTRPRQHGLGCGGAPQAVTWIPVSVSVDTPRHVTGAS